MKLPQTRRNKSDRMKWESLIGKGENALGFTAQTANGTAHYKGSGWNQRTYDYTSEQIPTAVSPPGSNRTGE
jgi:hypothetical protein